MSKKKKKRKNKHSTSGNTLPSQISYVSSKHSDARYNPTSVQASDGRSKVGGIFMFFEKITDDRGRGREWARGPCVCAYCLWDGKGPRGEKNQTLPELFTSLFTSQMFPQTLSVGCGLRRVESQYGFSWLVFGLCVHIIICDAVTLQWYYKAFPLSSSWTQV